MKNLPAGFIEYAKNNLPDSKPFLEAMDLDPEISIKYNLRKTGRAVGKVSQEQEFLYEETSPVGWCESGRYLPSRPQFTFNPLLHAGVFYVQDASSMIHETIIKRLIDIYDRKENLRVLDLCAAPGGKTTSIINAVPDGTVVVANEFMQQRAVILRENLSKWGYPHIIITSSPTDKFAKCGELFDFVVVDAPCSGEGMMRKEEQARIQWSEGLIRQCAALQREILSNAAASLRDGGYLIYSTCTFNTIEDEENAAFIRDSLGLVPVDMVFPEEWGILPSLSSDIPAMRFMPHATRGEGLFAAVFRKEVSDERDYLPRLGRNQPKSAPGKTASKSVPLPATDKWTKRSDGLTVTNRVNDTIYLASRNLDSVRSALEGNVRILTAGVPAADLKGKDWAPRTELALSTAFEPTAFPTVTLTKEEALAYLRCEAFRLPDDTPKGYVAVSFLGHPLGFVKNIGNRANNLYPSEWRIRSQAPK